MPIVTSSCRLCHIAVRAAVYHVEIGKAQWSKVTVLFLSHKVQTSLQAVFNAETISSYSLRMV